MNLHYEILMKLWELSTPQMRCTAICTTMLEKYKHLIEEMLEQKLKNETTKSPG